MFNKKNRIIIIRIKNLIIINYIKKKSKLLRYKRCYYQNYYRENFSISLISRYFRI